MKTLDELQRQLCDDPTGFVANVLDGAVTLGIWQRDMPSDFLVDLANNNPELTESIARATLAFLSTRSEWNEEQQTTVGKYAHASRLYAAFEILRRLNLKNAEVCRDVLRFLTDPQFDQKILQIASASDPDLYYGMWNAIAHHQIDTSLQEKWQDFCLKAADMAPGWKNHLKLAILGAMHLKLQNNGGQSRSSVGNSGRAQLFQPHGHSHPDNALDLLLRFHEQKLFDKPLSELSELAAFERGLAGLLNVGTANDGHQWTGDDKEWRERMALAARYHFQRAAVLAVEFFKNISFSSGIRDKDLFVEALKGVCHGFWGHLQVVNIDGTIDKHVNGMANELLHGKTIPDGPNDTLVVLSASQGIDSALEQQIKKGLVEGSTIIHKEWVNAFANRSNPPAHSNNSLQ